MLDLTDQVGWSLRSVFVWFTVRKLIQHSLQWHFPHPSDSSTATLFCLLGNDSGVIQRSSDSPWVPSQGMCRDKLLGRWHGGKHRLFAGLLVSLRQSVIRPAPRATCGEMKLRITIWACFSSCYKWTRIHVNEQGLEERFRNSAGINVWWMTQPKIWKNRMRKYYRSRVA